MGLAGVETAAVGTAAGIGAIAASEKEYPEKVDICGNYDHAQGYWLDREKGDIMVSADTREEAETVTRAKADEACTSRGRSLSMSDTSSPRVWPPLTESTRKKICF